MKRIYLDYAATSPVKLEVLVAMNPFLVQNFGNPSSIHWFGRQARSGLDESRKIIAEFLNCDPTEIIFTSGGTESDNLAIRGIINSKLKTKISSFTKPHIVTSEFEHHAILHTCKDLEDRGLAEVTYIKPDKDGIINVEEINKAIKPNTILVSIMYVNNEIGTVQPISEIAGVIFECNKQRTNNKIFFHTDAVQAVEYQEMDVLKLGVDMLSISAHKFGGLKGVGVLYVKKGTLLKSTQTGGAQEFNYRAGTENVAAIVGMAKVIQLLDVKKKAKDSMIKLRDYFIDEIIKMIPDVSLNGSREKRNPNNINISFKYIEGESILLSLDLAGIAASSGSACTSGSLNPSHVLLSIGLSHEDAHGSIRFTIGELTTKEEIDFTVNELEKIVKRLREMSPFSKEN